MDRETKAYLDEHFARQDQYFERLDERAVRLDERVVRLDERVVRLDERVALLEGRVDENSRQIGGLKDETRQTRVLMEGMRSDLRLVAEGVVGLNERLEAHQKEVKAGFEDVKVSIAPAYQRLDGRIQGLEARAERQTRDVLEVIREKFGKPQA
jgi:chromosome segregation ATPase